MTTAPLQCSSTVFLHIQDDLLTEEDEKLFGEFHGGKGIGAVAVSDEPELFRQLSKFPECHTHGEDAGTDVAVIRYDVILFKVILIHLFEVAEVVKGI